MTKSAWRTVWLAVALLSGCGLAQSPSGLLITTTSTSSDSIQQFHSYWITREGAEINVVEGSRLLVPRKAGWWEVGVTSLKRVDSSAQSNKLWAVPVGTPRARTHVIPMSDDTACPGDLNTLSLSWVGTDYVALLHDYESTCGNGPARSGVEEFTARLEDLSNKDVDYPTHLKLSDVTGLGAEKAMQFGAEVVNVRKPAHDEAESLEAHEDLWIVSRTKGHYRLSGTTPQIHGHSGDSYDIPLDPPKSLVGTDELAVGWDVILDKQPDALDAYTSPSGDLLVIVTGRALWVYEIRDQKMGALLKRVNTESPAVVEAQWASAGEVAQWNESLVPLLTTSPNPLRK